MGSFRIIFVLCIVAIEADKGGPRIKSEDNKVIESNAGETILLPCVVAKKDTLTDPEWFKGEERIKSGAWDRYRATVRGLRIKDVTVEDAGVYTCQILDGFGFNSKITVHLHVTHSQQQRVQSSWELSEESTPIPKGTKPEIKINANKQRLYVAVGDEAVIPCEASGDPKPIIQWVKNGRAIDKQKILPRKNSERGTKLHLSNLQETDSGQYTCVAINAVGIANATFTIKVIEREPLYPPPPEIRHPYPVNQTAEIGGEATFHCRVKSETVPDIQWLKLIDKGHYSKVNITWEGRLYSIIKSLHTTSFEDNVYVRNLTIRGVDFADEGIYLCLAGNRNGTHSRSAVLTVRPRVIYRKSPSSTSPSSNTYMITLMLITALFGLIVIFLLVFCLVRYHQKDEWTNSKYTPPLPKRPPPILGRETGLGATSWISHAESPRTHAVCIHNARPLGDFC